MYRINDIADLTDKELLARFKEKGDNSCIGELYKRYVHLVFGVCMKYLKNEDESKDAVMQVFEKLLKDLVKHEVENFKGWLYTLTKNHCLMLLRVDRMHVINEADLKKDLSEIMEYDAVLHQDNSMEKETRIRQLEEGITTLNTEQRTCVELFYLRDKSYQEVADLTGFDLNQVKSFIQNGKRNLKNYLQNKYEQ